MRRKTIILGWDGATFKILDKMVAKGVMPNLERVIIYGTKSELISTTPPITGPAWTSFNTGKKPEDHGVFSFFKSPAESLDVEDVERHNALSIDGLSYWNILNHSGQKCIVVDFPLTDPVEEIDGVMISGMSSKGIRGALISPEPVKGEIEKKFSNYFKKTITDGLSVSESFLDHLIQLLEEKSELDLYLMRNKEWDLFSTLFSAVDILQHYFWKYMDTSSVQYVKDIGIQRKIDEFFKKLDEILGKYCEILGSDGNLILVSDHGFGPRNYIFYVNNFLRKSGYLSLDNKNLTNARYKEIIKRIINKSDIFELKRLVKKEMREKINRSLQPLVKIKWEHSKAGFRLNNEYGVYINKKDKFPEGIVSEGEYKYILDDLINGFTNERNSFTGEKVFEKVLSGSAMYSGGKYSDDAPDIILIPLKGVTLVGFKYSDQNVMLEKNSSLLSGFHEPEGVFLGYGPGFEQGRVITAPLFIHDIAPLILHLAEIEPLKYMKKNIAGEILKNEDVRRKKVNSSEIKKRFAGVDDFNDTETIEALRGLGYLD